jgi:uncharacterized protein
MYFSKLREKGLQIGRLNKLEILFEKEFGIYLDGSNYGNILLPNKYIPRNCTVGDKIEVFIYKDSEDRLIATTEKPYAMVGDFAFLKVATANNIGAFLEWGLPKDIMVPFKEQKTRMYEDKSYVVKIYLDKITERIVASTKLNKFIEEYSSGLEKDQAVDLLIYSKASFGYNAIINNKYSGVLYKNEMFQKLNIGDKVTGYIKAIREDNKIDLTLNKSGQNRFADLADHIIDYLKKHDGVINITAKSSTEIIEKEFKTSKRNFKVAIGGLYKKRIILIKDDKIILLEK